MADKAWKQAERRVAKMFGSTRRPLSGMNSRSGGRDDCMHDVLFIENKHSKSHAVWTLYTATREIANREKRIPVVTLTQHRSKGVLFVVHSEHLEILLREYAKANSQLTAVRRFKPKRRNAIQT